MDTVRTRFAPSPTGFMHLGNLRSGLYAYLQAKHNDGVFILRIEDTDQARYVEGAVDVIYRILKDIGLDWDEGPDIGGDFGPYVQSERKSMYLPYAEELVKKGKAYYCFCTKEELEERKAEAEKEGKVWKYDKRCASIPYEEARRRVEAGEPYVIRQNVPETGEASFDDVLYGHIQVNCADLEDMILIKADGMPTYNFANVIDDHTMGITHVMRGNEYLASTPKYNLLYEAFGWEKPVYIHLSQIMKDAHRKLSKRYGDAYAGLEPRGRAGVLHPAGAGGGLQHRGAFQVPGHLRQRQAELDERRVYPPPEPGGLHQPCPALLCGRRHRPYGRKHPLPHPAAAAPVLWGDPRHGGLFDRAPRLRRGALHQQEEQDQPGGGPGGAGHGDPPPRVPARLGGKYGP